MISITPSLLISAFLFDGGLAQMPFPTNSHLQILKSRIFTDPSWFISPGIGVGDGGIGVLVGMGVGVAVGMGVAVGNGVGVAVGTGVGVGVGVGVLVGMGVFVGWGIIVYEPLVLLSIGRDPIVP